MTDTHINTEISEGLRFNVLSPGYDFKLQPVVRLQIGRSRVVGNVELPLNTIAPRATLTQSGNTC